MGCMNYIDFENASLEDKASFVFEHGILVEVKGHLNYKIVLFSLNSQFIEIYLDTYSGKVLRIGFATDYDMGKYINDIKLPFSYVL
jgi:hypothetical protein